MMPETQVYTIARQMFERHGLEAIAHAAGNALASEKKAMLTKPGSGVISKTPSR